MAHAGGVSVSVSPQPPQPHILPRRLVLVLAQAAGGGSQLAKDSWIGHHPEWTVQIAATIEEGMAALRESGGVLVDLCSKGPPLYCVEPLDSITVPFSVDRFDRVVGIVPGRLIQYKMPTYAFEPEVAL